MSLQQIHREEKQNSLALGVPSTHGSNLCVCFFFFLKALQVIVELRTVAGPCNPVKELYFVLTLSSLILQGPEDAH